VCGPLTVAQRPFLLLSLDVPPAPLFADGQGAAIVPQVPLQELLAKFDGVTWTERDGRRTQHSLLRLPRCLTLHLVRFARNSFGFGAVEKNSTIVTFPVRNLDLRAHLRGLAPLPTPAALDAMGAAELRSAVAGFVAELETGGESEAAALLRREADTAVELDSFRTVAA
jgi:hypothetical protein